MAALDTIGVSCGHRVPRTPIQDGVRKLYWCDECGAHRMSGGRSTGERGQDWAIELREVIADLADDEGRPLTITVERPLTPHGQRLVDSLGVEVRIVTPVVCVQDATSSLDCVRPGCPAEADPGQRYCRNHMTPNKGAEHMTECKIEGCENEAVQQFGKFGGLCETHRPAAAAGTPPPATNAEGSLADRARKLVPLARSLDRARAQLAALPEQTTAKAAFDEASRRASQSPTAENLARVGETLKQLTATAPKRTKLENDVSQAERALGLALQTFVREARAA